MGPAAKRWRAISFGNFCHLCVLLQPQADKSNRSIKNNRSIDKINVHKAPSRLC